MSQVKVERRDKHISAQNGALERWVKAMPPLDTEACFRFTVTVQIPLDCAIQLVPILTAYDTTVEQILVDAFDTGCWMDFVNDLAGNCRDILDGSKKGGEQ